MGILTYIKLGVGAAVLIAIGTLYFLWQGAADQRDTAIAQKALVQAALDQQVEVNQDNLVELAEEKRRFEVGMKVVSDKLAADQARETTAIAIRERLNRAPASNDGPPSPVLLDAVDGLRQLIGTPAVTDQNPVGSGGSTASPAPVP